MFYSGKYNNLKIVFKNKIRIYFLDFKKKFYKKFSAYLSIF